jgi:cytochrome b561
MTNPHIAAHYTRTAVTLHWILAIGLIGLFGLGLYMVSLPFSPQRLLYYNWHKWAGATVLLLSVVRLAWRMVHPVPASAPMAAWQRRSANAMHALLYALSFAVPLVGWMYSSASGFPVVVFALLPLPDLVSADQALAQFFKQVHAALAWTLMALATAHIGAALKHQFVDRDGLVYRMWPSRD